MMQVVVQFAEADLEARALEGIGDAAIELEEVATSLYEDDQ
jgi:hypothetical protein|eukprot:COSAG02_NODE_18897_length_911_cov_1.517241_3_plen_41_part_00